VSILNFGVAGTLSETDTSVHPNSLVDFFPPDVFPPFTSSDGLGSWKRTGLNRFRCSFIKFLFDETGMHIGLLITTLDLVVRGDGRLEGEGESDFIRGADPDGEVLIERTVGNNACGVLVQALDKATCSVSNVLTVE